MEEENILEFDILIKRAKNKSLSSIKKIIKENKLFWKRNITNSQIISEIGDILIYLEDIDKTLPFLYAYSKKEIMFLKTLELFTNVSNIPDIMSIDDYNVNLEEALKEECCEIKFFYELMEETINIKRSLVLEELVNVFSTRLPSINEIEEMKNSLDNMFNNESPEKLKLIESILSFNDPSLKQLKDIITNVNINEVEMKDTSNIIELNNK